MSGNLKILVHKSWHVWKRENREKVARDERKFKEDNEEKEERQKSLTQEKNLELLHESHAAAQALAGPSDQIVDVPFRLFGDIEELEKKNKELKDQNQAKKDKEFNDKKKSGEAPWALGEGAAEKIGSVVPYWYKHPSKVTDDDSNSVKIKSEWGGDACEEDALKKRQEARKNSLDPMNGILKVIKKEPSFSLVKGVIIKVEKGISTPSLSSESNRYNDVNKSKESLHGIEIGVKRSLEDTDRESKKEKKSRKSSHKSRELKSDDRSAKHHKSSSSSSSSRRGDDTQHHHNSTHTAPSTISTSGSNSDATMALRVKRMEREYAERKRAAIVLAKVDIYGPLNVLQVGNLPDGRANRYNQQFHPSIAR